MDSTTLHEYWPFLVPFTEDMINLDYEDFSKELEVVPEEENHPIGWDS